MRIAVASQNFRTITGHAGKTRRFLIFEAAPGQPAREVGRLDLPREMAIHDFAGDGPHPLDTVQAVIVGSAGQGFVRRMASRGVVTATTDMADPAAAALALAEGRLPPALPALLGEPCDDHDHDHGGCGCGGGCS